MSLAYKWIRIIFRCWKDGKPYDEEVDQKLLAPAPLSARENSGGAAGFSWKAVAGFKKLSENNAGRTYSEDLAILAERGELPVAAK